MKTEDISNLIDPKSLLNYVYNFQIFEVDFYSKFCNFLHEQCKFDEEFYVYHTFIKNYWLGITDLDSSSKMKLERNNLLKAKTSNQRIITFHIFNSKNELIEVFKDENGHLVNMKKFIKTFKREILLYTKSVMVGNCN